MMKTNYDHYKDEIKEQTRYDMNSMCYFINRLKDENFECDYDCGKCFCETIEWLNQEYKAPIKVTQTEYHILKGLDDKWKYIARDENGDLFLYKNCPTRGIDVWGYDDYYHRFYAFNALFTFIKWEDEEPYSIEELLKCEVINDD